MVPLLQEPYGVYRTVTNVGPATETYRAVIYEPADSIQVTVFADSLTFSSPGEKKSFLVTVNGKGYPATQGSVIEVGITCVSAKHSVRNPIIAVFGLP